MSISAYAVMVTAVAAIALSLGFGATRMRARLGPDWSGAPARLAEAVLGLAALVVALELVGLVGVLSAWPAFAACVATGLAMALVAGPPEPQRATARGRSALPAAIAASAIALLVVFEWARPVVVSLQTGMGDGDTVWYHMPFAAWFVQDGAITGLHFTGGSYLPWFYPTNSELVHSLGILLAGHHDVLSPLVSLGWLALALLAAWCVGRPFGAGAGCVAALALLLTSQLVVDREPGVARTDVAGLAFLVASAAVLVGAEERSRLDLRALAVAGLAAGLAIGTKLTLLAPVAVISVGVVASARRGWRTATATWFGCLAATGAFWYLRNLVHVGNPLPWVKLGIGPIVLAEASQDYGGAPRASVVDYATEPAVWRHFFFPGLNDAFGPLWPLILALAATGAVLAAVKGSRVQRILGAAAIVTALAYLANPLSAAGPEGAPTTFESNLRYLTPALALGLVLLPTALPARAGATWWAVGALVAILLVTNGPPDVGASHLGGALLIAGLAAALALAALLAAHRRAARGALIAAAAVVAAVALGWPALRDYARDRYRETTDSKLEALHMDAAFRWAQNVSDARIATTSILQYGLYGDDLSNRVRYIGVEGPRGTFANPRSCPAWRRVVNAGNFDFLVTAPEYEPGTSPALSGWARSPNATPILRSGPLTVYRLTGSLAESACPGATRGPPVRRPG